MGQDLVLRDTFTSGEDGATFQTVALAITDDGRYLFVGSLIGPVGVQVFEQLSVGVRSSSSNGVPAVRGGEHSGAKPGRIVHGPGYRER